MKQLSLKYSELWLVKESLQNLLNRPTYLTKLKAIWIQFSEIQIKDLPLEICQEPYMEPLYKTSMVYLAPCKRRLGFIIEIRFRCYC